MSYFDYNTKLSLINDSTGFGQHADYVFGWQGNTLQTAMDSGCYLRNCSELTSQMPEVKNKCAVPVTVREDVDGCKLPYIRKSRVR